MMKHSLVSKSTLMVIVLSFSAVCNHLFGIDTEHIMSGNQRGNKALFYVQKTYQKENRKTTEEQSNTLPTGIFLKMMDFIKNAVSNIYRFLATTLNVLFDETFSQEAIKNFNKYQQKAQNGDVNSEYMLGICYENGDLGVTKDLEKDLKWYKGAAEQGDFLARQRVE